MADWNKRCIGYWDIEQYVGNWDKQCAAHWDKQYVAHWDKECAGNWDKQCISDWDKQYIGYWDVTPRGPGGGAPSKPRVHAFGIDSWLVYIYVRHLAQVVRVPQNMLI